VTEELILSYPEAGRADIDRAVAEARDAFDNGPWPRMAPSERARYLRKVAELLSQRLDDIANAWTLQVGAPIMLTKKLVGQNPTLFNYYADLIETYPFVDDRKRDDGGKVKVAKEPIGVCAAITPWNAPLVLLSYKVAAGLAAGCTIVSKPSPETPLEAYILAECIEKAGLPAGVFNLVPAGRQGGDYLVRHKDVDKVAFTGSTAAGKHIAAVCAERLARVSLELGGKSPAILLDDADFAAALPSLMVYSMPITGQVCFSLTRILVPERRKQDFLDMFLGAVSRIKVGDPFSPDTQMGPLTMARQLARVEGRCDAGVRRRPAEGLRQGLLHRADRIHGRASVHEDCAGGDLRPGRFRDLLHRRGRRHPQGQQLRLRPERCGLHRQSGARLPDGAADADRERHDQRHDRRPEASVWRLQAIWRRT
jgi:acyl-CoA reductase-like NAD-dependent aldehyde dehydrogenase